MFIKRFELFKLFGFSVYVDLSWVIIAVLVTWSLAAGLFPELYPDQTAGVYWTMGVAGALGLFASIVLHELGHSLVARRYNMPMKGITLFIFGGIAEMSDESPSPEAEFMVAIGGPIVSVLIAVGSYALYWAGGQIGWPVSVTGVLWYLGIINLVVVVFNMVPAFPLDGGRVLRAILWQLKGSLRWATSVTSTLGSAFGLFLILLGVLSFIGGNFVGGMWMALIGLFLRGAASASYQQLLLRRALEGEPVSRFMVTDVHTVSPETTVEQLVRDYVYKYHHKLFPVSENGRLVGCITTRQIKEVPQEEWGWRTVQDVLQSCGEGNTIKPDDDAMHALSRMQRSNSSRLMVVEDGQLRGIISLKDLMNFMSVKIELEED